MLTYDNAHLQDGAVPALQKGTAASSASMNGTRITNGARSDVVGAAADMPYHRHIWIITGPAGCGKSTVAKYLATQLSLSYIEGDEYHTPANIQKMSTGVPLTDADRWDWLDVLRKEALKRLAAGASGVVLTCSALKESYRDFIRKAATNNQNVLVHFVYLRASEEVLFARVKARKGHYMTEQMVHSQIVSLEEPTARETDVTSLDVSAPMNEVQVRALYVVQQVIASDSPATAGASR